MFETFVSINKYFRSDPLVTMIGLRFRIDTVSFKRLFIHFLGKSVGAAGGTADNHYVQVTDAFVQSPLRLALAPSMRRVMEGSCICELFLFDSFFVVSVRSYVY